MTIPRDASNRWEPQDGWTSTRRPESTAGLRELHWEAFQDDVLPLLTAKLQNRFPSDEAFWLIKSLKNRNRFRASELLYLLLLDRRKQGSPAAVACMGAVELLQLARLILDDVVDDHKTRWDAQTLWVTLDSRQAASLVATGLYGLATELVTESEHASQSRILHMIGIHQSWTARGMLDELNHPSGGSLSLEAYKRISSLKAANGQLCAKLLSAVDPELDDRTATGIYAMAYLTDVAAAIANDYSEIRGLRGFDSARMAWEWRGDKSEIELGRPTIFDVWLSDDARVRSSTGPLSDLKERPLSAIPRDELAEILEGPGTEYAEALLESLLGEALDVVPEAMIMTKAWLEGGLVARIHRRFKVL